jgi:hypothetical protein
LTQLSNFLEKQPGFRFLGKEFKPFFKSRPSSPNPAETAPVPERKLVWVDIVPEWVPIQFDSRDLQDLHQWNAANQDKRLPTILERIAKATDTVAFKAALDLIPNYPFPAGNIVKALSVVVALGLVRTLVIVKYRPL